MKKKKWTHEKYQKMVNDMKGAAAEMEEAGVDWGEASYQSAVDTIDQDKDLKEFMRKEMGVQDQVGRLADDFYAAG